jgi:hypothetical protein
MFDLYLPSDQVLIIPAEVSGDMSDEEFDLEMAAMYERSQLAGRILNHGEGLSDLCDLINDQKYDVDSYLTALEECLLIS